ncbi:unnamed protein product [Calypogeia fissa]
MHVILQTGSQLHAHRLQLYLSSPDLQAFPSSKGFCTTAEELGTRESDHRGPCLVLLNDCKVSPENFNHHIRSTFLRGYIVRVYWVEHTIDSRAKCISHLQRLLNDCSTVPCIASGRDVSIACSTELAKDELLETGAAIGRKSELQLVDDCRSSIWTDQEYCSAAADAAPSTTKAETESKLKVRLQTYPRELAESLVDEFVGVDCQPHGFSHTMYVVQVDNTYIYGIAPGNHMYLAPKDRVDLADGCIARASLKLEETMQVLGFNLHKDMSAMDLGASPGAWTQYLSKHIKRVIAVDPAPLHQQVLQPNVTHISKMAQDATAELVAYSEGNGFHLLVCDVNRHPVEAAQVVSPLLIHLQKGGLLVLTLKFHGRGRDKEKKVEEIKRIFEDSLMNINCIWLLANSIYERTFVGIKI